MEIFEKMKGFLLEPSKTFDGVKKESLGEAFKYFLVPLVIGSLLSAIVVGVVTGMIAGLLGSLWFGGLGPLAGLAGGGVGAIVYFIYMIIVGIVAIFVGGLWMHIWVYLLGGRKGLSQTIKALMYGATPSLLLSWIPIINFIGVIWSIVLDILGIKKLQEMTTGRAIVAFLVAIIVPAIIVFFLIMSMMVVSRPF